jgi:FkbM family methyltransferase
MDFVSYAQNQEDVMLYRALREVGQGFYIDVGAQDPVIDSVTKAFYDRGWHGINIEPSEEYFQKLQSERPHDINLATAAGGESGRVTFYEVEHTGLSTTNPSYAERHSLSGRVVECRDVECTTLDKICDEYDVDTVHFLKIDVEGSERAVLEGFSLERVRPWLIVVEATEPNSDHEVFSEWEDLLAGHRYDFVYFDGLNRFYLAKERAELARHFSRPPNWFDQYVTYQLWHTRAELEEVRAAENSALVNSLNHILAEVHRLNEAMADRELTFQAAIGNLEAAMAERDRQLGSLQELMAQRDRQLGSLQELMAQRDRQLSSVQANLTAAQRRLKSIRSSVSWKVTSPLREIRRVAIRILGLFRRPRPAELPVSAVSNSEPAPPDEAASSLTEPARLVYRNLREAVELQRGKERKPLSVEERL